MPFPAERPRRLRSSERLRRMVRETRLTPERLIYPLFVVPGEGVRREIGSLPGCFHLSVDEAAREAREVEGSASPVSSCSGCRRARIRRARRATPTTVSCRAPCAPFAPNAASCSS